MFNTYAHTFIESVQSAKKMAVKNIVKHDQAQKICNDFIDAQTKYTKAATDTAFDTITRFYSLMSSTNLVEETNKVYNDSMSYFTPSWLKTGK